MSRRSLFSQRGGFIYPRCKRVVIKRLKASRPAESYILSLQSRCRSRLPNAFLINFANKVRPPSEFFLAARVTVKVNVRREKLAEYKSYLPSSLKSRRSIFGGEGRGGSAAAFESSAEGAGGAALSAHLAVITPSVSGGEPGRCRTLHTYGKYLTSNSRIFAREGGGVSLLCCRCLRQIYYVRIPDGINENVRTSTV